jgi:hypothetical protein
LSVSESSRAEQCFSDGRRRAPPSGGLAEHLAASFRREVAICLQKPAGAIPIGGKWSRRPATDGTSEEDEHCQRASGLRETAGQSVNEVPIWLRRVPDVADEKAQPERAITHHRATSVGQTVVVLLPSRATRLGAGRHRQRSPLRKFYAAAAMTAAGKRRQHVGMA